MLAFPSDEEVFEKVDQAINLLIEKDGYLLEIDANERAISHRLGLYLQLLFEDWYVDCEYNRNLDSPKRLETYQDRINPNEQAVNIAETDPITVFPDIIVHERGCRNNLLIIEIKKKTSRIGNEFDYFKLKEFKYQYGYRHALFLKLKTGSKDIGVEMKDYLPDQLPELKNGGW